LRKKGKLAERPVIVLIVTRTVGGKIVESILADLLERHFEATVRVMYVDIDVRDPKVMSATLGEYMSKVSYALSQGEPSSTCFAPIGGYKVMTSLGYIVGSFLNYPTAYLHEDHQVLHEIPPIPIHIREDFVQQNLDLLRKCQRDVLEVKELSYHEKQCIERYPSLFYQEDGLVCLSAFGQFLLEQEKYKHLFSTKYFVSKQVLEMIKCDQHQSLFIFQQMKELVKKLKYQEGRWDELQHEKEFVAISPKRVKYHLYKGASNGQTVFRLAYRYDQQEDILYANYLWLDHNRYEREVPQGKGIYEDKSEFFDITNEQALIMG
jgi:putative CRISPR-associated protein (TIGR02619 family)